MIMYAHDNIFTLLHGYIVTSDIVHEFICEHYTMIKKSHDNIILYYHVIMLNINNIHMLLCVHDNIFT